MVDGSMTRSVETIAPKALTLRGSGVYYEDFMTHVAAHQLYFLNLSYSLILHPDTILSGANYSQLLFLHLTGNNIAALHREILAMTPLLVKLFLDHNSIHDIKENTFWNTKSLEYLDLAFNSLIVIKAHYFMNLSKLVELNLNGNPIANVDQSAFLPLFNIQVLHANQDVYVCCFILTDVQCLQHSGIAQCFVIHEYLSVRIFTSLYSIPVFLNVGVVSTSTNLNEKLISVAHCLHGAYLVVIAWVDFLNLKRFGISVSTYRYSFLCHVFGFLHWVAYQLNMVVVVIRITFQCKGVLTKQIIVASKMQKKRLYFLCTMLLVLIGFSFMLLSYADITPNLVIESNTCLFFGFGKDSRHVNLALKLVYSLFIFCACSVFTICHVIIVYIGWNQQQKFAKIHRFGKNIITTRKLFISSLMLSLPSLISWLPYLFINLTMLADVDVPYIVTLCTTVIMVPFSAAVHPALHVVKLWKQKHTNRA